MSVLQQIIDRRLSGKNKSIGNRERFLRRYREQIGEAVKRAVSGRGIRDLEQGEDVTLPRHDVSEPVFGHGEGGNREYVHPGNREYVKGDRIERPPSGGGSGGGSQASDSGEGEDDFVFRLTKEEFMRVFFEDLALPHLIRTQLAEVPEWKSHRAGFVTDGMPSNLHVVRSMRGALSRRIALGGEPRRELRLLEEHLLKLKRNPRAEEDELLIREIKETELKIEEMKKNAKRIPFLDPIDLRYRNRVRVPVPSAKAVMFCLMDVSGSMDEARKDMSKRFFMLLYLFLTRHYDKIELVFIRHHTQATEVTEDEFFHTTETGGTVVSSALKLMHDIVRARYPSNEWNIYGAQASDGDNWHQDSGQCRKILDEQLLPLVRYYAYVQVADAEQNLWEEYAQLAEAHPNFAMRKVSDAADIYPVFRELFKKEGAPS
ncbi:MAG: YeaH/YhbH family protein [Proteobacteria bacterium]|nr:YeaH/YhbH family protein [Pseudomonadota bacterium]